MLELTTAIRITAILVGVHACYTALALLAVRNRYRRGGLLDGRVVYATTGNWLPRLLDPILSRFVSILVGRLLVGLGLVASAISGSVPASLVGLLVVTDLLVQFRNFGRLSSGFSVALVVDVGLFLAVLAPEESVLQQVAVLFIAAHGILGYVVPGIEKLKGPAWRNGTAPILVFSMESQGHATLYSFFQEYRYVATAVAWAILAFEVLFVFVLVVDPPLGYLFFAGGILLHATVAVTMRIPGFLFVFPATYPAIAYANGVVPTLL